MRGFELEISKVLERAHQIYKSKREKYGDIPAFVSPSTLLDLVFVKLWRLRNITRTNKNMTGESLEETAISAINYSMMLLYRIFEGASDRDSFWENQKEKILELVTKKNEDYNSSWLYIEPNTLVEIPLIKVSRLQSIMKEQQMDKYSFYDNVIDIVCYLCLFIMRSKIDSVSEYI